MVRNHPHRNRSGPGARRAPSTVDGDRTDTTNRGTIIMHMRFGTFMAPFHPPDHNPTLSLENDLQLLEHMDALGFDEAWIGEHHSAGSEIIASPEIFIMAAAERTKNIRLGTGVVSLPYHNPLWVAERIVLLDHLTRGRVMLGVGPGALPTDAAMLGLEPAEMRPLLEEYMAVLMHLLTSDEPISYSSDRLTLNDARLHLRPYSDPLFDVAVAAVAPHPRAPSSPDATGPVCFRWAPRWPSGWTCWPITGRSRRTSPHRMGRSPTVTSGASSG